MSKKSKDRPHCSFASYLKANGLVNVVNLAEDSCNARLLNSPKIHTMVLPSANTLKALAKINTTDSQEEEELLSRTFKAHFFKDFIKGTEDWKYQHLNENFHKVKEGDDGLEFEKVEFKTTTRDGKPKPMAIYRIKKGELKATTGENVPFEPRETKDKKGGADRDAGMSLSTVDFCLEVLEALAIEWKMNRKKDPCDPFLPLYLGLYQTLLSGPSGTQIFQHMFPKNCYSAVAVGLRLLSNPGVDKTDLEKWQCGRVLGLGQGAALTNSCEELKKMYSKVRKAMGDAGKNREKERSILCKRKELRNSKKFNLANLGKEITNFYENFYSRNALPTGISPLDKLDYDTFLFQTAQVRIKSDIPDVELNNAISFAKLFVNSSPGQYSCFNPESKVFKTCYNFGQEKLRNQMEKFICSCFFLYQPYSDDFVKKNAKIISSSYSGSGESMKIVEPEYEPFYGNGAPVSPSLLSTMRLNM